MGYGSDAEGHGLASALREDRRRPAPRIRQARGRLAHLSGAMAEDAVSRRLVAAGLHVLARRWRGAAGEIDMICKDGECLVFVEVKQGRTLAEAGQRLGRRQMDRICAAANEYCADLPDGALTEMRFDVALVDALGQVEILQNAFAEA